ncbi:hypothetical protein Nepgr_011328 [Nepenthes gracilis]|uniref:Uncharacterized protein n=1 Tax=Nepenthes gracilis TaxID=150966 RepID=A0AAD3SE54_NEPGR|nr:hypothetical protein Nepgr_011328 [Nepenthes gracilis]
MRQLTVFLWSPCGYCGNGATLDGGFKAVLDPGQCVASPAERLNTAILLHLLFQKERIYREKAKWNAPPTSLIAAWSTPTENANFIGSPCETGLEIEG